jgi:hypothetical protein
MSIAETHRSVEHERLAKALIRELKSHVFEIVNAASEGYEPSTEVKNQFPDVKAYNRNKEFVVFGLAMTCSELEDELTKE